jgi:CRISPR-associated protein (Cas_Cmr3)
MSHNTAYFIRPQSPLVFRGGAPFGAVAEGQGNQGESGYRFPLPGTTAGALRAAWVDGARHSVGQHDQTLLNLHVHGALRAQRKASEEGLTLYAPAPADARCAAREPGHWPVAARTPQPLLNGQECNLPFGLLPAQLPTDGNKESAHAPELWNLELLESWLLQECDRVYTEQTCSQPTQAVRQHVVIDPTTRAHVDQGFFETRGSDFYNTRGDDGVLAWLHHNEPGDTATLLAGTGVADRRMGRFGADGRAASFEALAPSALNATAGLTCPEALQEELDALQVGDWFRLLLITPACYLRNGWYPDGFKPCMASATEPTLQGNLMHLLDYGPHTGPAKQHRGSRQASSARADSSGWNFRLRAACVPPWQPMATGAQRADDGSSSFTRRALQRLAPAGTVYWFEILSKGSVKPLSSLWMQSTCREECARDGFGLALPGLARGSYAQATETNGKGN